MKRIKKNKHYITNASSKRGRVKNHRICGLSRKHNRIVELNLNISVIKMNIIFN